MRNQARSAMSRLRPWKGMVVAASLTVVLAWAGPLEAAEERPSAEAQAPEAAVAAEQPPAPAPSGTVTLEELLAVARANNPALQAARRRHDAALAVPSQARSLPDPMVMGGLRNVGDRFTTVGREMMSGAGASVQQMVPYPTKLSLKGEVAEREADRVGALAEVFERQLVRQVTVAYHDLFFIGKSVEIIEKDKDLLGHFAQTAEARYAVGKGIQQDVFRAQVAISRLIERLSVLRQREQSARARLNTLLNRPPETPLGRPVEVSVTELDFTQADMESKALEASPKVASARWAVARSRAKLNLAKAQYYPDFTLRAGWMSRERLDDTWEGWLGLTVPIYAATKQRYGVKEAVADLEAAEQELSAARDEVLFTIADQYARAKTAQEVTTLFRTGVIPQAQLSLESSLAGYEVGGVDFLTLLDNVKSLLDDELEYYREVTNFNKALATLEEAVGEPLRVKP